MPDWFQLEPKIVLFATVLVTLLIRQAHSQCASNQYDAGGTCQDCHVTCLTCTSSAETDCSTCEATTRQQESSSHTCHCKDGYVEKSTVAATCDALTCHYSCDTCNQTANFCTACPSGSERSHNAGAGTCLCNSKFYDNSVATCAPCHYSCRQCSAGTNITCTDCSSDKFREDDGSGNSCVCMAKYYDIANQEECGACSYKCKTCKTSAGNCLTCGDNRQTAPTCACTTKFYDDGASEVCQACHYSCATCTNSSACTTCNSGTSFRTLATASTYCLCLDRYFDTGLSAEVCSACHATCLTCANATTSGCTSCNSASKRTLNGSNTCVCISGFYQTAATTELCAACGYRCKTCSTAATNCTSCNASLFRNLSSNACPCMTGYYESSITGLCTLCHSSCESCTNGTQCATCVPSTLYQLNSSNLCSCNDTFYFNTSQSKCVACHYSCKTCQETSPTLCVTCDANRTLASNACPCLPLHFDDGSSAHCSPCHYSCLTCDGLTNADCLTCNTAESRTYNATSGKCLCVDGFYDNGSSVTCLACLSTCLTCTNGSTCASCDSTLFRGTSASQCPCLSSHFENSTQQCQACAYHCLTCSDNTTCDTCNSPNRLLNATTLKCYCPVGTYDNGVDETCLTCLPECLTCINFTKCVTCNTSGVFRELNANARCVCITKYWENSGTCTPCEYYCATCIDATVCETCNSTANRVLDVSTDKCVCKSGYFDDGSTNEECQPCGYACEQCITSANNCTDCDTTLRTLNTSTDTCDCPQYFFDDNTNVICPACDHTCSTCTNATHCVTCNATLNRTFDSHNILCECERLFYDDGFNEECLACSYKCQTCTNSTACATCDALNFRHEPENLCPCFQYYYETGTNNPQCSKCNYTCNTCVVATVCLTCGPTFFREYNRTSNLCDCMDGYYDDKSNELCLACVYSCKTCVDSSSKCLTCDDSNTYRQLNTGTDTCPCQDRYYDGNLDAICERCHYSCATCTDGVSCATCDASTYFRTHNATTDLCHCLDGYYDDGESNQLCLRCHLSCKQCTGPSACTTCDIARNRTINATADYNGVTSSYCICLYGHYSLGDDQSCAKCHYTCDVCSGPTDTECLYCNSTAHRSLVVNSTANPQEVSCLCDDGYFQDGSNELCGTCHVSCSKCTGLTNTSCTACNGTTYLLLDVETCFTTCPSTYFDNVTAKTCDSCPDNCLTCTDGDTCTECATTYHLLPADEKCYLVCPNTYYANSTSKLCLDCPQGCSRCLNNIECTACSTHYYFDSTAKLCYVCHDSCLDCLGPSQDQCTSCSEPLYFRNSKCKQLSCPYGQYVDSTLGCQSCASTHSNSLSCNKSSPILCLSTYKLQGGRCEHCDNVTGYQINQKFPNTCSEICGDGALFEYQCDDGNLIFGDGCSQNCIIEEGWRCSGGSTTTASTCVLDTDLLMNVTRIQKYSGENRVKVNFILSLPIRLSNAFAVVVNSVSSSDYSWSFQQADRNLSVISLTILYNRNLQGKSLSVTYNSSAVRRLLVEQQTSQPISQQNPQSISQQASQSVSQQTSQSIFLVQEQNQVHGESHAGSGLSPAARALSSIEFSTSLALDAFPPVVYYPESHTSFFRTAKQLVFYLGVAFMALAFVLIPKRVHLHALSFVYVPAKVFLLFGVSLETKTDWINYILQDLKPLGLINSFSTDGISLDAVTSSSACCRDLSDFYNYGTELVSSCLFVLLVWLGTWLVEGALLAYNKHCSPAPRALEYSNYFTVTLHLLLPFHLTYACLNALYFYRMESENDAFNTTLSVALLLVVAAVTILTWYFTYHTKLLSLDLHLHKKGLRSGVPHKNELISSEEDDQGEHFNQADNHVFASTHRDHNKCASIMETESYNPTDDEINSRDSASQDGYRTQQIKILTESFLKWDYVDLYKRPTSALNHYSKYYLPITFTFLTLQVSLMSVLNPLAGDFEHLYFLMVLTGVEVVYFLYISIARPFISRWTNSRLIFQELLFLALEGIMIYYLYLSREGTYYEDGEFIFTYLLIALFTGMVIGVIGETALSWRKQIWIIVQPCLIALRLSEGDKRVYDFNPKKVQGPNYTDTSEDFVSEEQKPSDIVSISEEGDGFYERVLKKEKINKKYRKERKMKENLYRPS